MGSNGNARVSVKRECSARFRFGGLTYDNIPVLNLGTDGCCIQVPRAFAGGLVDHSLLEGLELISPALAKDSIEARVLRVRSDETIKSGCLEAEVQFVGTPVGYRKNVRNYVNTMAKAKPQCVAHALIGMP